MFKTHENQGIQTAFPCACCAGVFRALLKKSLIIFSVFVMMACPVMADVPAGYTERTTFPTMSGEDYMKEMSVYKNAAIAANMLGITSGEILAEPVYVSVVCQKNQYLSGNTCLDCPPEYPNSNGISDGINQCYKTVVRGCTQNPCVCPEGSVCTCSECSCASGAYVEYHDGTTSGTVANETCSQQVAAATSRPGYFYDDGEFFACPKGTYKADSGNATSCTPASEGYYVDTTGATSQKQCPAGYRDGSNNGRDDITDCYKTVTRGCTQNQCTCQGESTCICADCECAGGTYTQYVASNGSSDGATSGTTTNETCDQTVATMTCDAGYYMKNGACLACAKGTYKASAGNATSCTVASDGYYVNTTAATAQTQCPAGYRDGSNNGRDDITDCYKTVTRACTQNEGSVPNNCASVTTWNACTCAGGTYNRHVASNGTSDGTAEGTATNETCTKTPSAVTANAGYYVNGASCSVCPSAYPNSEGGNIGATQCYFACQSKSVQNASSVTLVSEKIYNNGGSAQCTYNVICNDGYTVSGNGTANPSCDITTITCPAGQYLPANSTTCATCPEDSYCSGGSFNYPNNSDNGIKACTTGLVAPQGTTSAGGCGKIMYVDNTKLYLTKEKQTTPALAVRIDGVVYYANVTALSNGAKTMNGSTTKSLRTRINGIEYSIHDNTVQGE